MKYKWRLFVLLLLPIFVSSQKKITDLSIVYNSVITSSRDSANKISSTTSYFVKESLSRAEVTSNLFSSVTIYDAKAGAGVILKEVNGQKLLIRLNQANYNEKNKRFADLIFTNTNRTKAIAGYLCTEATASSADGFEISVFYTRDLMPANKSYDPAFKNLEGLPLEYELKKGALQIRYTLASVSLNPVAASKFDIPASGYRELSYEESKNRKMGNQ